MKKPLAWGHEVADHDTAPTRVSSRTPEFPRASPGHVAHPLHVSRTWLPRGASRTRSEQPRAVDAGAARPRGTAQRVSRGHPPACDESARPRILAPASAFRLSSSSSD